MPYEVVKVQRGWKVRDDRGNFYSKRPLTKTMARQQQKALYASESRKETLRGHGFASYVDEDGNHHIILSGGGFFSDIWAKIKSTTNSVLSTLLPKALTTTSNALNAAVRIGYPPAVRHVLAQYGAAQVVSLTIYRTPIESYINSALNAITLGKWNESRGLYNYDKLYHLALIALVATPTGDRAYIKIEKNEVINVQVVDGFPPGDSIVVPVACCITLREMMDNAAEIAGDAFYKYDAFNNNCQIFIMNILNANGLATADISDFVLQDVSALLASLPAYTAPFASTLTGLAGFFNRLRFGQGTGGNRRRISLVGMDELPDAPRGFYNLRWLLYTMARSHPTASSSTPMLIKEINDIPMDDEIEDLIVRVYKEGARPATALGVFNKFMHLYNQAYPMGHYPDATWEMKDMNAFDPGNTRPSSPVEEVREGQGYARVRGGGPNDIDPATGFTPLQQRFIEKERTDAGKERRRKQFQDYNAKFQHTVEMQPVFGEVNRADITGEVDASPEDKNAYLEGLLAEWKQSGKSDFKDYYYGENPEIQFNPTDPTTPTSASGSPAVSARKSAITGAWTLTYQDGSREMTRARNTDRYSANVANPYEQLQQVQGVADMTAQRIQDEYARKEASMSAADKFFEGLNDALIGVADAANTILPINPIASAAYDTFRPQTSSERKAVDISNRVGQMTNALVEGSKTIGESENDLFRGRLAGLVQHDPALQERLGIEARKGTVFNQMLEGLQEGSGRARRTFARQLRKAGLSPTEYLKQARQAANKNDYDGRALEFSDDDEHKLMIYDDKGTPVRFGAVNYGDHIIWKHLESIGKVKPGYAEQKRRVFNRSHTKIKGSWASNKFSPNSLALSILWT